MDPILIVVIIAAIIGWRFMMHSIDKSRIIESGNEKGWRDIEVSWAPFAPGALFEKGERHYSISYTDLSGMRSQRYCKTSMLTGVFWRD